MPSGTLSTVGDTVSISLASPGVEGRYPCTWSVTGVNSFTTRILMEWRAAGTADAWKSMHEHHITTINCKACVGYEHSNDYGNVPFSGTRGFKRNLEYRFRLTALAGNDTPQVTINLGNPLRPDVPPL